MAENLNEPHAICGAKKRNGEPCPSRPMPNGRCRMHGGATKGGGAQPGNQNARKHGLFSPALSTDIGLATYEEAAERTPKELTRDTAAFMVAKLVEAFQGPPETHPELGAIAKFLGPFKSLLDTKDEDTSNGGTEPIDASELDGMDPADVARLYREEAKAPPAV